MSAATAQLSERPRIGLLLDDRLAAHGSAAHAYFASQQLLGGDESPRNLADAVHFLCALHGLYPGVIDHALARTAEPEARAWLESAAAAFAVERRFLAALAVAVGPLPGTPGGGASEAAVASQRGALATLAGSERRGCALGAAIGLIADWGSVRALLAVAARRLGIEPPPIELPNRGAAVALAEGLAGEPAYERALLFGAEQLLVQHFGLWSLLEAREQARRGV